MQQSAFKVELVDRCRKQEKVFFGGGRGEGGRGETKIWMAF